MLKKEQKFTSEGHSSQVGKMVLTLWLISLYLIQRERLSLAEERELKVFLSLIQLSQANMLSYFQTLR